MVLVRSLLGQQVLVADVHDAAVIFKVPPGQAMPPPHTTKQCYHHTPPRTPDASQHKADQHLMQYSTTHHVPNVLPPGLR
jgi:hypothetical protein